MKPSAPRADLHRALALEMAGSKDSVREHYERLAADRGATARTARLRLAQTHVTGGDLAAAIGILERQVEQDSAADAWAEVSIRHELGARRLEAGRVAEAMELLESTALSPAAPEPILAGRLALLARLPDEAAMGLSPEDRHRLLRMQRARAQGGEVAPLLATLAALVERDELRSPEFEELASEALALLSSRPGDGSPVGTRAALGPKTWAPLRRIAQACTARKHHDLALCAWTLLRRSLRTHRGNRDASTLAAVIGRARSLIALGEPRAGHRLLRETLRIAEHEGLDGIARSARIYLVASLRRAGGRAARREADAIERAAQR